MALKREKVILVVISALLLPSWISPEEAPESVTQSQKKKEAHAPIMKVIEYGGKCEVANPDACQYFPVVTCVTNSKRISVCRCSYLRTWIPEENACSLNVFSPCSKGLTGIVDLECTANADCVNDTLGINSSKFCRCKKGYEPKLNEEEIPAFCVPKNSDAEDEDLEEDYEFGSFAMKNSELVNCCLILTVTIILAFQP